MDEDIRVLRVSIINTYRINEKGIFVFLFPLYPSLVRYRRHTHFQSRQGSRLFRSFVLFFLVFLNFSFPGPSFFLKSVEIGWIWPK